jgi:hypothetical protein
MKYKKDIGFKIVQVTDFKTGINMAERNHSGRDNVLYKG